VQRLANAAFAGICVAGALGVANPVVLGVSAVVYAGLVIFG